MRSSACFHAWKPGSGVQPGPTVYSPGHVHYGPGRGLVSDVRCVAAVRVPRDPRGRPEGDETRRDETRRDDDEKTRRREDEKTRRRETPSEKWSRTVRRRARGTHWSDEDGAPPSATDERRTRTNLARGILSRR
ncbi:uncharacterized protein LOC143147320 [Ptiloglossa arizonensis]|uniref:uncharacterized protein LOC143147320 n=1 Tax=Ptiloglossa arizonensis TaxID=3350558 RepID=UPI003FA06593